jgi:hypothetical protein
LDSANTKVRVRSSRSWARILALQDLVSTLMYSSVLGQEYADFGNDIHHFAQGLNSIRDAVERAKGQAPSFATTDWDLTSLQSIVGDFVATIEQCEELVLRNPKFQKRSGFVVNIVWSLDIGQRVKILRNRVSFHCSKASVQAIGKLTLSLTVCRLPSS